jgi:hypothetical protein
MSGWDLDHLDAKALEIWLSIRSHHENDVVDPSSPTIISTVAGTLTAYLTSPPGAYADEFDDFANRFARLMHALIEFCLLHPRSMDWGITVLFQVIKSMPADAVCELGEGPEGGRLDLERFFGNYVGLYSARTRPRVGTTPKYRSDVKDQFAVQFSSEEVEELTDDVVDKMVNLSKTRWKSMTMQCFAARFHGLETPTHPYNGDLDERLLVFLDLQLDLMKPAWNKIDCIGLLTMLRGSASYLLSTFPGEEREKKKQGWIKGLKHLLSTSQEGREVDDKADDFRIKYHAAVSFQSLASSLIIFQYESSR